MNNQKSIANSILSDIKNYGDITQLGPIIQVNTNNPELYNLILEAKSNCNYSNSPSLSLVCDKLGDADWYQKHRFIGTDIKHSTANAQRVDLVYADFSNSYGLDAAIDVINHAFTYVAYIAVHKPSLDSEAQSAAFYQALEKKELAIKHISIDESTQVVRLTSKEYEKKYPAPHLACSEDADPLCEDIGYDFTNFTWGGTPERLFTKNTKNISKLVRFASLDEEAAYALRKPTSLEIAKEAKDIFNMEGMYRSELESITSCFEQLDLLSATAINEVGLTRESIERRFSDKLESLHARYWEALLDYIFDKEGRHTDTAKNKALSQFFGSHRVAIRSLPFSAKNAKFFVNYLYKLLNQQAYKDFMDLVECAMNPKNVTPYTSNLIDVDGVDWPSDDRWAATQRERLGRCKFNNKIVSKVLFGNRTEYDERDIKLGWASMDIKKVLSEVKILAYQLGLADLDTKVLTNENAQLGRRIDVPFKNGDSKNPVLSITLYKNGKLHLVLSDEFVLRLNIMFGKAKGWLSDAQEAYDELNVTEMDYDAFKIFYESISLDLCDIKETEICQFLKI